MTRRYRLLPTEIEVLRENGDGTVTVRDLHTGATTNIRQDMLDTTYEEITTPPMEAPGFLGKAE